jgi:hypothetical protein
LLVLQSKSQGSGNASTNVRKHHRDSNETKQDFDPSKHLRTSALDEKVFNWIKGQAVNERIQQMSDIKQETNSSPGGVVKTPELTLTHGSEPSPESKLFGSPEKQPNMDNGTAEPSGVVIVQATTSGPQIEQPEIHQSKGIDDFSNLSLSLANPPDMSRQTDTRQFPGPTTRSFLSNQTEGVMASQGPSSEHQSEPTSKSMGMADQMSAISTRPTLDKQRSFMNHPTTNARPKEPPEQLVGLTAESAKEIQRHLEILTEYYSHVHKYMFQDIAPAREKAKEHWINSARQWESICPEQWKARLPPMESNSNVIQGLFHRQSKIQVKIETERRKGIGMRWQHSEEWQDDINVMAFKKQLKLMQIWTILFDGMLKEIRSNFPLFEDALEEFRRSGGWSPLLGPDKEANINGL